VTVTGSVLLVAYCVTVEADVLTVDVSGVLVTVSAAVI